MTSKQAEEDRFACLSFVGTGPSRLGWPGKSVHNRGATIPWALASSFSSLPSTTQTLLLADYVSDCTFPPSWVLLTKTIYKCRPICKPFLFNENIQAISWDECLCLITVVKFDYGRTYETISYGHKNCTSLLTSFILHFSFTNLSVTEDDNIAFFCSRVFSCPGRIIFQWAPQLMR